MINLGTCGIEQTVKALEQTIEKKKMQMQDASVQSGSSPIVSHLFSEVLNRAGGSYGQISLALEQGGEFARNFINKAQQNIEDKPWDFLRKVAIYSFGIGLFLSLRHRKPTGEKE
jgi:hypothetical protein